MKLPRENFIMYVRNFIFGAEDSLVSTVGLLSGITTAGVSRADIILTGVVLIFVEAFSMGAGSFLSEETTEEYHLKDKPPLKKTITSAVIMLVSYFIAGLIPLSAYLLDSIKNPFWVSIIVTLVCLFLLGTISAKILKINLWHSSWRMFLIGGLAVVIGALIGRILQ